MATGSVRVVFVGGSLSPGSRTERFTDWCARLCAGNPTIQTQVFHGRDLDFPFYRPGDSERDDRQRRFIDAMSDADGLVLLSPAYHGTISGLLKNALDYVNDLAGAERPYLDGRAIGCVVLAQGEQGAGTTLTTLRTVGHALRGWPTPLGVALTGGRGALTTDGEPVDPGAGAQLRVMLGQVLGQAAVTARRRRPRQPAPATV